MPWGLLCACSSHRRAWHEQLGNALDCRSGEEIRIGVSRSLDFPVFVRLRDSEPVE